MNEFREIKINWVDYWLVPKKQEDKPKFQVWDYVVYEDTTYNRNYYLKIYEIIVFEDWSIHYNWYWEKWLRLPTEKELELYYR